MTYKITPRGSVGFFTSFKLPSGQTGPRDMRYRRTGRAGALIREQTKQTKISTYNDVL
jgi:hypothetical protein